MPIRIAIIGYGKIAHDEHRPAILANPAFTLVATAGGNGNAGPGIVHHPDARSLIDDATLKLDAVAICTPPDPRFAIARDCLSAGLDVLLEKPPCATLGAAETLVNLARGQNRTLFAAWHSQFAPAVAPARAALEGATITTVAIDWREDVRRHHPGQDWVLAHGGFGVFDPGINALSILTAITDARPIVERATLIIPSNREAPIAATLSFVEAAGEAVFDWRALAPDRRCITVTTHDGRTVVIDDGGGSLTIDGAAQPLPPRIEYPPMYARFAALIATRAIDVDLAPLGIVADAFMVGTRPTAAAFDWGP